MEQPALKLNENHRRTLLAGFRYIDRLLTEGSAGLAPAEGGAIFSLVAPDATPVQRKVISDQMARVRRAVRAALDSCSIAIPPPDVGALRSLQAYLISVDIALDELGPNHLRGYGSMDDATADGIRAFQAQVRTALSDLQKYAASGLGGDLGARLRLLDQTRDGVRLLGELERIITEHGLVELRPALSLLLDRMEFHAWTVAFVGRVSSGKSSLLNYLLETDLLPCGVTPVTAVPIRIIPGAEPTATVSFARDKPVRVPGRQLGAFASEECNPGNARHVTDILLEMPSARLSGNVCFVDTPGLGSLATAGAAQTLAFLPRCDLGVFLLDCAGAPTEEDLAVARTMLEGGAEVLVVLSKADLLAPAEREKMTSYVLRQFAEALARELPVSPVSVADGHRGLTEAWYTGVLAPRQAEHRRLAAEALRRKAGALKEAVAAALARRARVASQRLAASAPSPSVGAARAALETHYRQLYDVISRASPRPEAVWTEAADILSKDAYRRDPGDFPNILAAILVRIAARMADAGEAVLDEARQALFATLEEVRLGTGPVALPIPSSRPLFDPSAVVGAVGTNSTWRGWPQGIFRLAVRRQLHAHATAALEESLRAYGSALVAWGQNYLVGVGRQFNAEMGFAEVGAHEKDGPASSSPELMQDLALLRDWNGPAEAVS